MRNQDEFNSSMSKFVFKVASTVEEIEVVKNIRKTIFIQEQGIPEELDADSDDKRSIHLLGLELGEPPNYIGAGRLTINDHHGILSRICILKLYRNKGIGKLIIIELEEIAKQKGVQSLTLTPHNYLEKFYNSLGYERIAGEKLVGQHKLITMMKLI